MNVFMRQFGGMLPKVSDRLLPEAASVTATNVDLRSGNLASLNGLGATVGTGNTTIFLDNGTWRNWALDVDVVRSPVSTTRIVYTDGVLPKIRDGSTEYTLGIPAPTAAVTVAAQAKASSGFSEAWHMYYEEPNGSRVDVDTWVRSIRNATYRWTVSGSGTSEYYLELAAGGNPGITEPANVYESATAMTAGTVGSLTAGQWDWGDNDALGFSTVYVRLTSGGPDPDSLSADTIGATQAAAVTENTPGVTYTQAWVPLRISATANARFVLWVEITSDAGEYLGQIIPTPAKDNTQTDAVYNGATVTGALVTTTTSVLTLSYDTSRASEYELSRAYKYTYLRRWPTGGDDEGPPSPESAIVAIDPTEDCNLTVFTAPPSGYGITHIRIYRTVTGAAGTQYHYVDEIAIAVTTHLDEEADSVIGQNETLLTDEWVAPPATLKGLRYHPGGFLVGFDGKDVYFSEPYQPHAWPVAYSLPADHNIVGLGVIGQTVVTATEGIPVLFTGSSPDAMIPERLQNAQSCTSKRSVVETGAAVVYASPDGLVSVSASGADLITELFYKKSQWEALTPSSMICAYHDNQLFVFTATGCKIFRKEVGGLELTQTSDTASGVHVDLETDTLYLAVSGEILPWGGGSARTYTARSRTWVYPRPTAPAVYRLTASGSVTINLYADDALVLTQTIAPGDAEWLPELQPQKAWAVQIEGTASVDELALVDSMRRLEQAA